MTSFESKQRITYTRDELFELMPPDVKRHIDSAVQPVAGVTFEILQDALTGLLSHQPYYSYADKYQQVPVAFTVPDGASSSLLRVLLVCNRVFENYHIYHREVFPKEEAKQYSGQDLHSRDVFQIISAADHILGSGGNQLLLYTTLKGTPRRFFVTGTREEPRILDLTEVRKLDKGSFTRVRQVFDFTIGKWAEGPLAVLKTARGKSDAEYSSALGYLRSNVQMLNWIWYDQAQHVGIQDPEILLWDGDEPASLSTQALGDVERLIEDNEMPQLSAADIAFGLWQMIHAVAELHDRKIVHHDVKAANFLLFMVDGRPFLRLSDFGGARHQKDLKWEFTEVEHTLDLLTCWSPPASSVHDLRALHAAIEYGHWENTWAILTQRDAFGLGEAAYKFLTGRLDLSVHGYVEDQDGRLFADLEDGFLDSSIAEKYSPRKRMLWNLVSELLQPVAALRMTSSRARSEIDAIIRDYFPEVELPHS